MLGLLFLYFTGNYFHKLANEFSNNKSLFAVLGIVLYYVGTFIGWAILGIMDGLMDIGFDWDNNLALRLIALPFGIAAAYLFHFLQRKQWDKSFVVIADEIQDIGNTLD